MNAVETGRRIKLENVLFATDFSLCSEAALPYALAITRQYGATLYAAHVVPTETYVLAPDALPLVRGEQWLDSQMKELEKKLYGAPYVVLTRSGAVWDELARAIKQYGIDLLVVGTHGRTGLRKVFMGSVAEKIFREAPCPVLSVGPNVVVKPEGTAELRHILFATEFKYDPPAALPYAISLAQEHQARLSLLHVVEQPEVGTMNVQPDSSFWLGRLKQMAPQEIELWCRPEYCVEFGQPVERILQFALEERVDLIVLGVHGVPGGLSAFTHLAHSTVPSIVSRATCPVLTVRE
jgi:nucleotide-binding universal stress UspA family protein